MLAFWELVKRNMKIYLRDKGAVFFSLLSMLIVLGLTLFFLGDMNVKGLTSVLSDIPGRNEIEDLKNAKLLVTLWTCAGIIAINAPTVTLAVYSAMIKDRTEGRLGSIETAPIGRLTLAGAYVAAAWICSILVCILTLALSEIYCMIQGGSAFSIEVHGKLLLMIAGNSFVYATLMYLLASFVKTEGAWSGIGTVIGTLVGFLGGIYIPIGTLADGIASLLKCTPMIYGTKMFRSVMVTGLVDEIFKGLPELGKAEYMEEMGISISCFDQEISNGICMFILLVCGMTFLLLSVLMMKQTRKYDR